MRKYLAGLLFCVLAAAHLFLYPVIYADKNLLDQQVRVNFVLPAAFTSVTSLDFKGLAADYQFLQANFFIGEKIERSEKITLDDWAYFKRIIDAVTDLDPYFYDPYYFASGMLAWGPHLYTDSIDILKKGMRYRTLDRRLPFLIGFYYFYFLDDTKQGAEYLSIAARYPDAPPYYATLASRVSYYAGDHESSVLLLNEMLENTSVDRIRGMYQKRLLALDGAIRLERAVGEYKLKFGISPKSLRSLVDTGITEALPIDPYGGQYILLETGRVFSTSKFSDILNRVEK